MILKTINGYDFIIDQEDFEKIKDFKWSHCNKSHGSDGYYIVSYIKENGKSKRIWLHRYILNIPSGKGIQIDHKNGDSSDNRKENLRICPRGAFNAINRPKQKNNTSGYKGVFLRANGKYRAAIRVNQRLLCLGTFDTKEEAALKYNQAAILYFGEYAFLNEIKNEI